MSYKERLSHLDREGSRSLTGQIVDAIEAAITAGELAPGQKLPPTRELAELAGVNHLTAARAYRRLAERGLVAGRVGQGTFVRAAAPVSGDGSPAGRSSDATAWQQYVLPEDRGTYGDRVLAEMFRHRDAEDVIPLMVGYPSPKLFPRRRLTEIAAEVMSDEGDRALQYGDVDGVPELRAELAKLGRRWGGVDQADEIVCTSGARQALTLVARAILRPGDIAACESPTFIAPLESLKDAGARVLPVPMDDQGLDTEALEQLLRRHEIRVLTIQARLNNPTGRDLAPERRERLVELARRHGFFIIEDGVYADLRFEGEPRPSLRALDPDHVVYVDSLSKTLAPGLRLGWVAASGPVLDRIAREKRNDDMAGVTLSQLVMARYLAAGEYEAQLEGAIAFHRERCEALLGAVDKHLAGLVTSSQPLGGAHLWLELADRLDERDLYDEARRQGVTFLAGAAMLPGRPRSTCMRISYCYLDPDQLVEGARRLGIAIRAMRRARAPREAAPIA
jgi:DNA-binding transcriptional MocR family regulator